MYRNILLSSLLLMLGAIFLLLSLIGNFGRGKRTTAVKYFDQSIEVVSAQIRLNVLVNYGRSDFENPDSDTRCLS